MQNTLRIKSRKQSIQSVETISTQSYRSYLTYTSVYVSKSADLFHSKIIVFKDKTIKLRRNLDLSGKYRTLTLITDYD
jgi:hypothetical protein